MLHICVLCNAFYMFHSLCLWHAVSLVTLTVRLLLSLCMRVFLLPGISLLFLNPFMTSCGWLLWQMTGEATDIGIFIIALYLFNYIMCHSCSLATVLKRLYRKEKERN